MHSFMQTKFEHFFISLPGDKNHLMWRMGVSSGGLLDCLRKKFLSSFASVSLCLSLSLFVSLSVCLSLFVFEQ